jgi:DNA-directed RNA polymerase specialized sigma24 family protein
MPRGRDAARLDTSTRCPAIAGGGASARTTRKRTAARPVTLPWPRDAEDGTPLGVDLEERLHEVAKLIAAGRYRVKGVDFDDLVAEVCLVIARRNRMPSAFDPRKASFGRYVHLVTKHTCANLSQTPASRSHQIEVLGAVEWLHAPAESDPKIEQFERLNAKERARISRDRAGLW